MIKEKIKSIIFDFGGVISKTLFETHELTEASLKLPPNTLQWRGPFDPDSDSLWESMQDNKISERDYWKIRTNEVGSLLKKDWTEISDFVRAARGTQPLDIIRPEALQIIDFAVKKNIRLAVLSNELDLFYGEGFRDKLPFLNSFEIIHDATYTNILKPDPRSYNSCLKDLGLLADQCIFIDDQPKNILGAKRVGLNAIQFNVLKPKESFAAVLDLLK